MKIDNGENFTCRTFSWFNQRKLKETSTANGMLIHKSEAKYCTCNIILYIIMLNI